MLRHIRDDRFFISNVTQTLRLGMKKANFMTTFFTKRHSKAS